MSAAAVGTAVYRGYEQRELDRQGNAVEVFELKGRNHFDCMLEWADPESPLFRASCAMLGLGTLASRVDRAEP